MKILSLAFLNILALTALVGCDKKSPPPAPAAVTPPATPAILLSPASAVETAPEIFKAKFATTKGDFTLEVHRAWAPHGADRFYNLVKIGFFDNVKFFRVVDGFMAQVGIHGDPAVAAKWREAAIADDPASGQHNTRAMATFATAGPNTRTTQFFLNFRDNSFLDNQGFPPFGKVIEGDSVLDSLYRGYGDAPPQGNGPDQNRLQIEGNVYLKSAFPNLDSIKTARILP